MSRRKLINAVEAQKLRGLATDEDSLIRHYTLDASDRLECKLRRHPRNKLGFAIQLCVMRQSGRTALSHAVSEGVAHPKEFYFQLFF